MLCFANLFALLLYEFAWILHLQMSPLHHPLTILLRREEETAFHLMVIARTRCSLTHYIV